MMSMDIIAVARAGAPPPGSPAERESSENTASSSRRPASSPPGLGRSPGATPPSREPDNGWSFTPRPLRRPSRVRARPGRRIAPSRHRAPPEVFGVHRRPGRLGGGRNGGEEGHPAAPVVSGRGFHGFKALRRILRALGGRGRGRRRVRRPAAVGRADWFEAGDRHEAGRSGDRSRTIVSRALRVHSGRRISGRGFNLFNALQGIIRASVTPKPFTLTRSRRA